MKSDTVTFIVSCSGEDITRRIPLSIGFSGSELTAGNDDDGRESLSFAFAAREPAFKIIKTAATATITAPSAAPEIIRVFLRVAFILYLALKKYLFFSLFLLQYYLYYTIIRLR